MISEPLQMSRADNPKLSVPLLIKDISSGSYSKITYNYNSHISLYTVRNHIQAYTQVHKHNNHRYNYL
jgi:hypothetical protein